MASQAPEVNFFDPAVNDCPYHAYEQLRDEAPVWKDPATGMYVLTRYEDVRMAILLDTKRFSNGVGNAADDTRQGHPARERRAGPPARRGGAHRGAPAAALRGEGLGPPARRSTPATSRDHMQMRRLFDHAFRPSAINELDPYIERRSPTRLIDDFIDDGRCEWVRSFAVPLPLIVIGRQVGVPEEDMPTDQGVDRRLDPAPRAHASTRRSRSGRPSWRSRRSTTSSRIFERLREQPDDTLLCDLVNNEIPEWGRTLNDNELHAEMMADLFVGGSETTTNALVRRASCC